MRRSRILLVNLAMLVLVASYGVWEYGVDALRRQRSVPLAIIETYTQEDLSKQIRMFVDYRPEYPTSSWMLRQIARRGEPAYVAILPYLKNSGDGLRQADAIETMGYIHQLGFNLRGTAADSEIDELADRNVAGANRVRTLDRTKPPGYRSFELDLEDSRFLDDLRRGRK